MAGRKVTGWSVWFFILLPFSFLVGVSAVIGVDWIVKNIRKTILQQEKVHVEKNEETTLENTLFSLPEALTYYIMCYCDVKDLCALSQVNKQGNRLANDPYLWRNLVRRDFFKTEFTPEFYWKGFYKNWELLYRASTSPFLFCCQNGITEGYFEKNWKLEQQKPAEEQENAMYHAVMYGKPDLVQKLIDMNQNPRGYLYLACKSLSADTVKVLLENGVEPHESMLSPFESPIHFIAETENMEIMKILLEYNADVNTTNFRSQTPLQISVQHGKMKMAEFLLENNANVNIPVEYSGADLPLEGFHDTSEIVDLLVRFGSDLDVTQVHWFGVPQ